MKRYPAKAAIDLITYMLAFGILSLYWRVYSDTRQKAYKRRK